MACRNLRNLTLVDKVEGNMKKILFAVAVAPFALAAPASAQLLHRHTTTTPKHHGFLHRAAAGVGAYEIAKHTGNRRAAAGGKRNLLQRHPVLTGLGAYKLSKHRLHH